jgi:hypothetical protein
MYSLDRVHGVQLVSARHTNIDPVCVYFLCHAMHIVARACLYVFSAMGISNATCELSL